MAVRESERALALAAAVIPLTVRLNLGQSETLVAILEASAVIGNCATASAADGVVVHRVCFMGDRPAVV